MPIAARRHRAHPAPEGACGLGRRRRRRSPPRWSAAFVVPGRDARCARTSPRSPRSTARPRRRGRLDQLPRPDGPAGGTPMKRPVRRSPSCVRRRSSRCRVVGACGPRAPSPRPTAGGPPRRADARAPPHAMRLLRRGRASPGATTASRTTSPSTCAAINGALEVDVGPGSVVVDAGTRTYFKSRLGWSSALVEPEPENVPAPDHRWSSPRAAWPHRSRAGPTSWSKRPAPTAPPPRGCISTPTPTCSCAARCSDTDGRRAAVAPLPRPRPSPPVPRGERADAAVAHAEAIRSTRPAGYEAPSTRVRLRARRPFTSPERRRAALQRRPVHGVGARAAR